MSILATDADADLVAFTAEVVLLKEFFFEIDTPPADENADEVVVNVQRPDFHENSGLAKRSASAASSASASAFYSQTQTQIISPKTNQVTSFI